jgi:hypothetical protein
MELTFGFTCTRDGWTKPQERVVDRLLSLIEPELAVHGGGRKGDELFDIMCRGFGIDRRIYPASNLPRFLCMDLRFLEDEDEGVEVMPASPAPGRNLFVVGDADVMCACPATDKRPHSLRGQGTWHTIEETRKAGKPLFLVLPSGLLIEERMVPYKEELSILRATAPKVRRVRLIES